MLYLGADHAGFELKEAIKDSLRLQNIEFEDLGPKTMVPDDDYPDIAHIIAVRVGADEKARGILVCGSGIGICMAANKHSGIRAGLGYSLSAAESMRSHNNANVLCLAGRVLQPDFARAIVRKFLETKFSTEEKHARRIKQVAAFE